MSPGPTSVELGVHVTEHTEALAMKVGDQPRDVRVLSAGVPHCRTPSGVGVVLGLILQPHGADPKALGPQAGRFSLTAALPPRASFQIPSAHKGGWEGALREP